MKLVFVLGFFLVMSLLLGQSKALEVKKKACPDYIPSPESFLLVEDCKNEGTLKKSCQLYCDKRLPLKGDDRIICDFSSGQWIQKDSKNVLAICDKNLYKCNDQLFEGKYITSDCVPSKSSNIEVCQVACRYKRITPEGKKLLCNRKTMRMGWETSKPECKNYIHLCFESRLPYNLRIKDCAKDKEFGYPKRCHLYCDEDYILVGDGIVECDYDDGQWFQKSKTIESQCVEKPEILKNRRRCKVSDLPEYLHVKNCSKDKETGFNKHCEMYCDKVHHTAVGPKIIKCDFDDGKWFQASKSIKILESSCIRNHVLPKKWCDIGKVPHNVRIKNCSKDEDLGLNKDCSLYCDKNYFLFGSHETMCDFNKGEWTSYPNLEFTSYCLHNPRGIKPCQQYFENDDVKSTGCTKEGEFLKKCRLYCEESMYYVKGEQDIFCNFTTGTWYQKNSTEVLSICIY